MDETKNIIEKIKKETEKVMCEIAEEGLDLQNIETLYKAVDIHKDLANEEYWEKKKEKRYKIEDEENGKDVENMEMAIQKQMRQRIMSKAGTWDTKAMTNGVAGPSLVRKEG